MTAGSPFDRRVGDRRVADRRAAVRQGPDRRSGERRRNVALFLATALGTPALVAPANGAMPEPLLRPPLTSRPSMNGSRITIAPGRRLRGPKRFHPFIEEAAATHSVSASLIEAVIRVESSYNPRAVSRKGAQGLMQLMPDTAARFGVKDAFDPRQNVFGGARYLRWLLELFEDDIELACAAYNAGEKKVLRYGGIPPYRETREYVQKIRRILEGGRPMVETASAMPPQPMYFYTWTDARGVLNVSQYPPPAGQKFEKRRVR